MTPLWEQLRGRLVHLTKTARMWGSPDELEAVALHLSHLLWRCQHPDWTLERTQTEWTGCGGPFAADAEAHLAMRRRLWGEAVDQAQVQVVAGYAGVWAGLDREPAREAQVGPWLEALLDEPGLAGTPDRLNATLFTLMGLVAANPQRYVEALGVERDRIGGHHLRPLHVVAAFGPTPAGLTYTDRFSSWDAVVAGIGVALTRHDQGGPG